MELLLPVAKSLITGKLVSVHDVARGRACQCCCPSCGMGVVARQGEVNAWSFAHDATSEHQATSPCTVSFQSVSRYMDSFLAGKLTQ